MSEQEFENYIALLSKLLRLENSQRDEIGQELRDHMSERLSDLLKAGYSREQATRLAIEEFGDAAGLANQFLLISRQQRRRWMMRFATFSIVGCFVAAIMLISMWPTNSSLKMTQSGTAQDADKQGGEADPFAVDRSTANSGQAKNSTKKKKVKKTNDFKTRLASSNLPASEFLQKSITENNNEVELKLANVTKVEYFETALNDVLEDLKEKHELSFYVKTEMLETLGITTDELVTISLPKIRLSMLLELILEKHELTHVVQDGIVIITTKEDAEAAFRQIKVYNCRDLIDQGNEINTLLSQMSKGGGDSPAGKNKEIKLTTGGGLLRGLQPSRRQPTAENLIDLISNLVQPESWDEVGGPGTISAHDGLIAINNTTQVHNKVESLLAMMRTANKEEKE